MSWSNLPPVATVDCADAVVPEGVLQSEEPLLLRGLVAYWPALACERSVESAARYLGRFAVGSPLTVYVGDASIDGSANWKQKEASVSGSSRTSNAPASTSAPARRR